MSELCSHGLGGDPDEFCRKCTSKKISSLEAENSALLSAVRKASEALADNFIGEAIEALRPWSGEGKA